MLVEIDEHVANALRQILAQYDATNTGRGLPSSLPVAHLPIRRKHAKPLKSERRQQALNILTGTLGTHILSFLNK